MTSKISYTKPSITDLEIGYAADAAAEGWGDRCYEYIDRFEDMFKTHLGVKHAIATSSCTGALHMGLMALGIGPGDEVILADINWIASVAPVVHLGAKPVFVDILAESWCLDPEQVEAAITPRTKAIIAVHLYGNLCDMTRLLDISEAYKVPVIEDSAEAIGSVYFGNRAGSMGCFGTFSFHGTKTITTGEGGMFVTNDSSLFEKVLTISNHGRSSNQTKQFWADTIGHKFKMSNLQAAIGCGQLERVDALIARKRDIFHKYKASFEGLPVQMNPEYDGSRNGYWMPTIVVSNSHCFARSDLMARFREEGIDARVFFWPLSMLPMFKSKQSNAVSYAIHERAFNLPSYHDITATELDSVIKVVVEFLA